MCQVTEEPGDCFPAISQSVNKAERVVSTEMIDSRTTTVLLLSRGESAGNPAVCLTVLRRKYVSPRTSLLGTSISPCLSQSEIPVRIREWLAFSIVAKELHWEGEESSCVCV